jgi:hypothetical protein
VKKEGMMGRTSVDLWVLPEAVLHRLEGLYALDPLWLLLRVHKAAERGSELIPARAMGHSTETLSMYKVYRVSQGRLKGDSDVWRGRPEPDEIGEPLVADQRASSSSLPLFCSSLCRPSLESHAYAEGIV